MRGGVAPLLLALLALPAAGQELTPGGEGARPRPAAAPGVQAVEGGEVAAVYRFKGARELWPEAMHDDGSRVFIHWGRDQAIPAVFMVNDRGEEEMLDGYMRDDIYVIDRISAQLSFRIDKAQASATRQAAKAPVR